MSSKGKQPELRQDPSPVEHDVQSDTGSAVRRRDKILAACAGGTLTSLTMTPLDVIKTRLQTQPTPVHCSLEHGQPFSQQMGTVPLGTRACCGQLSASPAAKRNWSPRFGAQVINPSTYCPAPCLALSGPSTISHLLHNNSQLWLTSTALTDHHHHHGHPSRAPASGIFDTVVQIIRHEGVSTLWRGVGPALLISIPAQAIYMLGYDTLRSTFLNLAPTPPLGGEPGSFTFYHTTLAPMFAGAISRSAIAVLFSPLELIRTRLQSAPKVSLRLHPFEPNRQSVPLTSRKILHATLSSVRSLGFSSLYAGLPATLWRDVPFSAIYWSSYEVTRKMISGGKGFGEADSQSGVRQLAVESFLAGSVSGGVAAMITNGFDVVKTRRQAQVAGTKSLSTMRMIIEIARREGIRNGLMKGLSPRLAKVIPSCGIMIVSGVNCALLITRLLKNHEDSYTGFI